MYQQLFPHDAAAAGEAPPPQAAPPAPAVGISIPTGVPQPVALPLQPVAPAWGQGQAAYPIPTHVQPVGIALPPALGATFLKAIQNLLLDNNGNVEQPRSAALSKLLNFIAPLTDAVLSEVVAFAETKYSELPPEAALPTPAAPTPFVPGEVPQSVMIPRIPAAYPVQVAQPMMIQQIPVAGPSTRPEPPRAVMTTDQYRQAGVAVGDLETEDEPPEEETGEEEDEGSDYSLDDDDEFDEA